jgi:hypothetical protein
VSGPFRNTAGDGLLHPIPLLAIGLLLVNDHVLKAAFPGPVTGKLSDIAGLVLLPLALIAMLELAVVALRRPPVAIGPRGAVAVVVVVAVAFAATKLTPLGAEAYRNGLGLLQWPFRAILAVATAMPVAAPVPVSFIADPGDVLVLPMVLVPLGVALRRSRRRGAVQETHPA